MYKTYYVVKKTETGHSLLSSYQPVQEGLMTLEKAEAIALQNAHKAMAGWRLFHPGADIFVTWKAGSNRINPGFPSDPVKI